MLLWFDINFTDFMLQILNKKVKNGANIEFCIDLEMTRKMSEHQFFFNALKQIRSEYCHT